MDAAGALETLLPQLQPADLWERSGRWAGYTAGEGIMFHLEDRQGRELGLGPTHEEVITALAAELLRSYRQLPVNLYQIQTKFRDEIRPRFGLMRGREFIMKDAYSFHASEACLRGHLRGDGSGLPPHLRALRSGSRGGGGRQRGDRRLGQPGIHGDRRGRRRPDPHQPRWPLRRQPGAGRLPAAGAGGAGGPSPARS